MTSLMKKNDSGASAILVAISLVVLMGMAAIGIDYALGTNERRLDQTGVDTAVMAGAVELVQAGTIQQVVDEVRAFVDTNVRTLDPQAWVDCTDPDKPSTYLTADHYGVDVDPGTPGQQGTECVSFFKFERIRVQIPDQATDTAFGRVIGVDSLTTSALAEALTNQFTDLGSPPPFALLNGFGGGDVVCLRSSSSGEPPLLMRGNGPGVAATRGTDPIADADPCDNNVYPRDSENFGLLDPTAYFDSAGNVSCKSNANDYFLATGIDHPIGSFIGKYGDGWDPGDPELQDAVGCSSGAPVSGPDTMPIKTGLTASELRCGLITARSGGCSSVVPGPAGSGLSSSARLHKGSFVQSSATFLGESMDNAALWQFFVSPLPGAAPAACGELATAVATSNPSWDYYDKRDKLLECMQNWDDDGPIFRDDIITSSRFGFIPLLAEQTFDSGVASPIGPSSCPSSGGNCIHIDDFAPIWLQTLYTTSPNSSDTCVDDDGSWAQHHAGEANSCGRSNGNLDRVSAVVIDCGMLPVPLCQSRGGNTPGGIVESILQLIK